MTDELKQLRALITESLDKIIDVCSSRGEEFPKLSDPVSASEFTPNSIRNDPAIMDAIPIAISAAAQIAATLQNPVVSLFTSSMKVSTWALALAFLKISAERLSCSFVGYPDVA